MGWALANRYPLGMPTPQPIPFPVDVLDNWVDYGTLMIAALSLVATAVGAFLIWRQIRQTGAALRLANAEQEMNRHLLLDSRRARIDDEMPKLLVWVTKQATEAIDPGAPPPPRLTYNPLTDRMVGDPNPLLERVFNVRNADDMATELEINLSVVISNDGPRRALVTLSQDHSPNRSSDSVVVEVGTLTDVKVIRRHNVAEWIDYSTGYYKPRADGQDAGTYSEVIVLSLYYPFPGRVGAVERWTVVQGGGILEPVDEQMTSWRLRESIRWTPPAVGGLNAVVPFPSREYFADMQERRPLGEIS